MKACLLTAVLLGGLPLGLAAQDESKSTFEVYGFAMMDAGYNFDQIDPAWFDVVRPTKLPAFENQFAPDGNTFFSVRQTRFGVRSTTPTSMGDLKTTFEFEMFGTGVDAGQTTIRLRHAYGELGRFGAGQTWSPFMDIDVFPEHGRVLGAERNGLLPERPGALHADSRRHPDDHRARAAGRQRRPGRRGRPDRDPGRQAAVPGTRPLRASTIGPRAGDTSSWPALSGTSSGRTRAPTRST